MDKRVLQAFAVWAKDNLEQQVEVSLKTLGINGDNDFCKAQRRGEYTIIDGDPNSYSYDLFDSRNQIINQVMQKGYKNLIEEVAYTWFNRLVALRFIELHNFLPHGFRVLSSTSGSAEPDILKNINHVKDDLRLDIDKCDQFKAKNKIEELFRYVLIQQCNALSDILPMLFSWELGYMELLLPKSMLIGDTILTRLIEIPEDNFMNDVEIIGWMYQFYISAKKDAVNAAKKTITKDTLPAITQLFTPDWIVRYMAENSVGRIWMESYPKSQLRCFMKYYVDDPEQTKEVQKKLEEIKYKNVDPINIHIIEPCSGSGHILVYVMDLLYKMYEEKGYSKRDIPTLILKNNLVGLDVDKRAAQLASFALIMKARTLNNRFFRQEYYTLPQVYEIQDSHIMETIDYKTYMKDLREFSDVEISTVSKLVDTFENGKTIGSLIKIPKLDCTIIECIIEKLEKNEVPTMFGANFVEQLKILLNQANILSAKYDVMITNPPYISPTTMDSCVKNYVNKIYPNSKTDMFAMFMETGFVKSNGFTAMINMHNWMTLSSYEELRKHFIQNNEIVVMSHLGAHAFEAIGGEIVQTTAFIARKCVFDAKGVYFNLVESTDKENDFLLVNNNIGKANLRFLVSPVNFKELPGYQYAYWVSTALAKAFEKGESITKYIDTFQGIITGDNPKFLRLWHEVPAPKIPFHQTKIENVDLSNQYWIPYNKGGEIRKWYGVQDYVVYWKKGPDDKTRGKKAFSNYYLREYVAWSYTVSNTIATRYYPSGFLWDVRGSGLFDKTNMLYYLEGLISSKVGIKLLRVNNSTPSCQVENIIQFPIILDSARKKQIDELVIANNNHSRDDWDSFETSWDFKYHPLLPAMRERGNVKNTQYQNVNYGTIASCYECWAKECQDRFDILKANEEELNHIFIDIYGLHDELTPEIENKDITVSLAVKERDVKSLISYLIGIVMGRYSLDKSGVVYAGGKWDDTQYQTYHPDDDGIVPIYRGIGMKNGLTAQLLGLLKLIYGEDSYRQNIDFMADAIGRKNNESSEEALNRYLNDGFFSDHLKTYQKRPIYWLFSSGKNGGFKCLVYMHRYTNETLARINSRYFLPESTRLKNDLEELAGRLSKAEGREQVRLEKERQKLVATYNEAIEYGQLLDHMANQYVELNFDDGVKVNYEKFQNIEMVTDSGNRIKKNLLAAI